jgi:hypothetical protein
MAAESDTIEPATKPAAAERTADPPKGADAMGAEAKTKQAKTPKQASKGKGKEPKKKPKRDATDTTGGAGLSIAAHPRAARTVARAKGWGGLVGFLLGGYLSLPTNTFAGAGLHALIAGVVCYVAVWAGAVFLWRHLVVAELRTRQHELLQAELARLQGANPSASARAGAGERTRAGASW